MFKRFLKFLKGEEDAADIKFDGSYLEHLFEQIRPFVREHLEACPDHDPHLLVVVGLLQNTMPKSWSSEFKTPLVDWTTIGVDPPPAPTENAGETAEIDVHADTEATDEVSDDLEINDSEIVEETDESSEASEAESDEGLEIISQEPEPSEEPQNWSRITEEIDIAEVEQHEQTAPRDTTLEIKRDTVPELGANAPRADAPKVLQAGRVFLTLLLENDALPIDLQLNVSETVLARDLLLGYFAGSDNFEDKARRLLALVEKKFGDGLFSQARILLQLFHTDEQTRVNNDRNLFYEDMILRLGIRRRHPLSSDEMDIYRAKLKASDTETGIRELARWMDEVCLIKFHLLLTDPKHEDTWARAVEPCSLVQARGAFLERVPPRRWRPLDAFQETIESQICRHVSVETARRYVLTQIKTCYFILRAVGDTGLEGFLDTFFDWTHKNFDVNGTTLMPILYNRSMQESLPMSTILDEIYDEFFAEAVKTKFESFSDKAVKTSCQNVLKMLSQVDLAEFAPGYYDLGGFVFDDLFGIIYPSTEFASKVHRIT